MNELYEAQEHLQKAQHALQKAIGGGQIGQRNNSGWNGGGMSGSGNGNYNQRENMPWWYVQKMMNNGGGEFEHFDPRFM